MRSHMLDDERNASPADLHLMRNDGTGFVPLRWRAFGRPDDLELNVGAAARARVVTELLARCRQDEQADLDARRAEARRLTLSGRIGGLAVIVARTVSSSGITVELRCPKQSCGASLQVALSLASLLELSQHAERQRSIAVPLPEMESVHVRRPTGDDQQAWQSRPYETTERAERAMVESLLAQASPLSRTMLAAIDAALEDADPLTCFRVATACPTCGEEADHAIDLESLMLARLHRAQRILLHDIHRLATRYGWSEDTIAALPSWRRQEYLAFIDREEA